MVARLTNAMSIRQKSRHMFRHKGGSTEGRVKGHLLSRTGVELKSTHSHGNINITQTQRYLQSLDLQNKAMETISNNASCNHWIVPNAARSTTHVQRERNSELKRNFCFTQGGSQLNWLQCLMSMNNTMSCRTPQTSPTLYNHAQAFQGQTPKQLGQPTNFHTSCTETFTGDVYTVTRAATRHRCTWRDFLIIRMTSLQVAIEYIPWLHTPLTTSMLTDETGSKCTSRSLHRLAALTSVPREISNWIIWPCCGD